MLDPSLSDSAVPVLVLEGIERRFTQAERTLNILRGADAVVEPGELTALIGPSGAGKSTLLHIAGLLERPDGGTVRIMGQTTSALDDKARTLLRRHHIGFVYQFHHLLPEFSALENIVLPQMIDGHSRKQAERKAMALLERVGLKDRAAHRPARLSGGEQQRVAIARALANDPCLLIADEPTGNLDPETAQGVFDLIRALVHEEQRMGALIATHNLEIAARMDKSLRLRHGILHAVGEGG
jgi:lipoprotein-releasing system ATP-binding protein